MIFVKNRVAVQRTKRPACRVSLPVAPVTMTGDRYVIALSVTRSVTTIGVEVTIFSIAI